MGSMSQKPTTTPKPAPSPALQRTARLTQLLPVLWLLWAGCGQAPVSHDAPSAQCKPNQCQVSGSLKADGSCVYSNKADGTGCDDNNSCTVFDTCKAGVCTGGSVLRDGATCDDKNVCTQTDICQQGICVGTNPLVCPKGDACHEGGTCDPKLGCSLKSYGPCVEGLAALAVSGCAQSDYTAQVTLGGQSFSMLLDSGSTTTAVATPQCANCLVTPTYTPGSAAVDQKRTAQAAYGDSTGWSGKVYMDTLLAGSAQSPLTPTTTMRIAAITKDANPNQPFFTGSTCGTSFDKNAYQGILGLGPSDLAVNYTDSFMDKVAALGKLTFDAFAVNLCDVGGQMWFGGFNPLAVTQAPNFTPMVTKNTEASYYAIAIDDILIRSTSVGLSSDALGPAVVDTGTAVYVMSEPAFLATAALIEADSGFAAHFPKGFFAAGHCAPSLKGADAAAVAAALPSITLTLPSGGSLSGMQVTMEATKSYLLPRHESSGLVFCPTLAVGTTTVLGSSFMRGQVLIFDREHEQMGFAPQTSCPDTLPNLSPAPN